MARVTLHAYESLDWKIRWDGTVDWQQSDDIKNVKWTSNDRSKFLTFSIDQSSGVFEDPQLGIAAPFSHDLNEAENYSEIYDGRDWKPASMTGDTNRQPPVARRPWTGE